MSEKYLYKRILIKLSGETLKGEEAYGYEEQALKKIASWVKNVVDNGVEVVIVVGAGNIWRGVNGSGWGMDRVTADYMGMLATVMNGLSLRDAFNANGVPAILQTSIKMEPVADSYNRDAALEALEQGKVVIFSGGTGNPFFTTDTTSALRALEMNCDAVLKATQVDGVYTADPKKDPTATRYEKLSFTEALSKQLKVMDASAFSLCNDNNLPIIVFNFSDSENLERVLKGDTTAATVVS